MTTGNPAKLIIRFMIPMFLGNLFQQFYNVVDSIVAGQFLGVQALAAIGSTGSLMFFVIGWLNGLTSGFAIMVAPVLWGKERRQNASLCGNVCVFVRGICIGYDNWTDSGK